MDASKYKKWNLAILPEVNLIEAKIDKANK